MTKWVAVHHAKDKSAPTRFIPASCYRPRNRQGASIMMATVVAPFLVTGPGELAELLVLLVLVVGIIFLLCFHEPGYARSGRVTIKRSLERQPELCIWRSSVRTVKKLVRHLTGAGQQVIADHISARRALAVRRRRPR
jgi:hypothetical protein